MPGRREKRGARGAKGMASVPSPWSGDGLSFRAISVCECVHLLCISVCILPAANCDCKALLK